MPVRLPLTFQQEWLWKLARRHESWQCVAVYAFRLRGELNISLLQECFAIVIRRHDALRTRIVAVAGTVWQEITECQTYPLQSEAVPGASAAEIEANARHIVEEVCDRRMDLSAGPFWRARLLRLSGQEHWLVLAMHRLVGDCPSIDQAYRDIRALYIEFEQGRPSPLKTVAQYSEYAISQRHTDGDWRKRHEPYWSKRLAGAAFARWPTDPSVAPATTPALAKMSCFIGAALTGELRELARQFRTLAPTLMMAIYAAVLWSGSRQTDFVLPFNIAGRQTEHKAVIGYFSYVLYLRVQLTGHETFKELVARLGNEFFGSLSHQDFGRMALQYPELLEGTLFQWVTWHPDDAPSAPVPSALNPLEQRIDRVCIRDFGEGLTLAPPGMTAVEVTFFDTAAGLHAFGSYRSDLFGPAAMERLMSDLRSAMELFVRHPDTRIAELLASKGSIDGPGQ